MVIDRTIHKVLRRLEVYFIKQSAYKLSGKSYDLIMLVPSETDYAHTKYSWIISSRILDNKPQKEVMDDLLNDFRNNLTFDEYSSISRINVLNSNLPIVKNLKFVIPVREELIELNQFAIGGIQIDKAYILQSKFLEKVAKFKTVVFITNNDEQIPAGIIGIDNNWVIKYFTSKGLQEIWKPQTEEQKQKVEKLKNQSDDFLLANSYIGFIKLNEIYSVQ